MTSVVCTVLIRWSADVNDPLDSPRVLPYDIYTWRPHGLTGVQLNEALFSSKGFSVARSYFSMRAFVIVLGSMPLILGELSPKALPEDQRNHLRPRRSIHEAAFNARRTLASNHIFLPQPPRPLSGQTRPAGTLHFQQSPRAFV